MLVNFSLQNEKRDWVMERKVRDVFCGYRNEKAPSINILEAFYHNLPFADFYHKVAKHPFLWVNPHCLRCYSSGSIGTAMRLSLRLDGRHYSDAFWDNLFFPQP